MSKEEMAALLMELMEKKRGSSLLVKWHASLQICLLGELGFPDFEKSGTGKPDAWHYS